MDPIRLSCTGVRSASSFSVYSMNRIKGEDIPKYFICETMLTRRINIVREQLSYKKSNRVQRVLRVLVLVLFVTENKHGLDLPNQYLI